MATIIKKGLIGEQDQYNYDGVSTTFTRETSTGSTITLLKEGYEVDVLVVYGGCESYNSTTINSALTAIGTTNKVAIVLRPGTWTMNASITIPSNVTLKIPLGAVITTTGYTLTFNGGLEAGYYQIFTGTGTVSGLSTSIPEWWGAVADGSTDCYAAIQAAINCALSGTYGGEVILSPGWYMVKTTGLSVVNGTNKAFWMHGAGQHSTVILTPGTGLDGAIASGNLITWTSTGYPTSISDMTLSVSGSGNLNIDLLDIDTSDGVTVNNLWLSAAYCGLHVSDGSSNIRISNIQTEYNTLNYHIEASYMITMSNYHSHRAGLAGVYITGTDTAIAGLYSGGIVLNGGSLVQDGYGGGGERWSYRY